MPATPRSYIAGKFALELEGVSAGFLKSVQGGGISADVITEPSGPEYFARKHIGQPKYEEFELQLGFNLGAGLYDWIAASWTGNYQRKSGRVIAANYNLESESEREFSNALVTETTIPAMDASSKDPAFLTVKFAPEFTRRRKATGKLPGGAGKAEQRLFLPSNFRLEIDGLDCTRVNKIDALTVKQAVFTDDVGDARDVLRQPGKLEFPNVKVSLAEAAAETWTDWFEDFVVNGNNGDKREKNGALVLLSPNLKAELARVNFFNLGICRLGSEKAVANSDAIKRLSAELYCERMELHVGTKEADVVRRVDVAVHRPLHDGAGDALRRRLKPAGNGATKPSRS